MTPFMLQTSDVLKCPVKSLMPTHYRMNGTCRCDELKTELMRIGQTQGTPIHVTGYDTDRGVPIPMCGRADWKVLVDVELVEVLSEEEMKEFAVCWECWSIVI